MKILFCGGGTAGHIYPAIAIAQICKSSIKDAEFLFVGRVGGDENKPILEAGYKLIEVDILGLPRRIGFETLKRIKKAINAIDTAEQIIKSERPDLVIGTGGYVCWPVITAAERLGVPTIIHESNAIPGLSTKLLAKKCDAVLLGFSAAARHIRTNGKLIVVGNPVREEFCAVNKERARSILKIPNNRFLVVSFGGSLGAAAINDSVIGCFSLYKSRSKPIMHIHSCGRKHYKDIISRIPSNSSPLCKIVPYIEDMPLWLSAADLAITRSGAITLAELAATETPSILIPSPNVVGNHQFINASVYQSVGAAVIIEEKHLTSESLFTLIEEMRCDNDRRTKMQKSIKVFQNNSTKELISRAIAEVLSASR